MEEVELHLLQNVRPKLSFDKTTPVTGADLALLLKDHVNAINKPGCLPNLESSWVAVLKLKCKSIFSEMLDKYTRVMEERTSGSMPMEETSDQNACVSLMQLHWSVFDECYDELKWKISSLQSHHVNDDLSKYSKFLLEDFTCKTADFGTEDLLCTKSPTGGILLRFVDQNYKLSEAMCEKLWDNLFEERGIHSRAVRALNQSKAIDLSSEMAALVEVYMDKAVGPAKLPILHLKQAASNVDGMLRGIPGPPIHVRLAGWDKTRRKIRWDPPAINPTAAKKYVIQTMTSNGAWKDITSTDKCWIILDNQPRKECMYRVTSWSDDGHSKGEMEEPIVIGRRDEKSSIKEELTYM